MGDVFSLVVALSTDENGGSKLRMSFADDTGLVHAPAACGNDN